MQMVKQTLELNLQIIGLLMNTQCKQLSSCQILTILSYYQTLHCHYIIQCQRQIPANSKHKRKDFFTKYLKVFESYSYEFWQNVFKKLKFLSYFQFKSKNNHLFVYSINQYTSFAYIYLLCSFYDRICIVYSLIMHSFYFIKCGIK